MILALKCGFPGAPAHSTVEFSTPTVEPGTVARYTCDRGFELLGPARRMCGTNGTWVPQGIPFCGKLNLNFFFLSSTPENFRCDSIFSVPSISNNIQYVLSSKIQHFALNLFAGG